VAILLGVKESVGGSAIECTVPTFPAILAFHFIFSYYFATMRAILQIFEDTSMRKITSVCHNFSNTLEPGLHLISFFSLHSFQTLLSFSEATLNRFVSQMATHSSGLWLPRKPFNACMIFG